MFLNFSLLHVIQHSLFSVRKAGLPCPNENKPEQELVTLTTVVAVPHDKNVHSHKVHQKVKQMLPSDLFSCENIAASSYLL
jgi:hypothetical protein